jgi:hypothetical protein
LIRIDALSAGDELMKYIFLILAAMLVACTYNDPHQNFLKYQSWQLGKTIDEFNESRMRNSGVTSLTSLIQDGVLENGHGHAKYWYVWPRKQGEFRFNYGVCMEIYEYDRVSRKILKTSFEGNRCVWNP